RAEGADAAAVDASPQHRRHHDERHEGVPDEAVLELRHAQVGQPEDVAHRHQAALGESQVADRGDERDVLEGDALAEEADERERGERCEQRQVERLRPQDLPPAFDRRIHYFPASGSSCLATMRALSRMARVALAMLIEARDTASTSPPTRNGSLIFLPLNCMANFGATTEK